MIKKLLVLIFISAAVCHLNAQIVPFTINLDTSITRTNDSALVYVKNPTNKIINVVSSRVTDSHFVLRTTAFNINANDSMGIWVVYTSYQNLSYFSFLICETVTPAGGLKSSIVYGLFATSKYSDPLYSFSQGLIDEPLKAAIKTFCSSPYTVLGYNAARDRMFETVDDYGGDTIECIYTGIKIHATNRTEAQNLGFNTEHTWPQSLFSSNDPMVSDLNHLFPTENNANNVRSNYQFGFAVSGVTWSVGGSKLGRDVNNNIVFEPRDKHKGNCARAMFYFVIRHQNWGSFMTATQETALRQFNLIDTVDARERLRNDRVKQFQNNRNAFCDHPEFIERIRSFSTTSNTPLKAKITASPFTVKFDTVGTAGDTTSYSLAVMNSGNTPLSVSTITFSNPVFSLISAPTTVTANQYGVIKIKFMPDVINQAYNGTVTIANSDSTIIVNLTGVCGATIGIVNISNEIPREFKLSQNYPNPFNPSTIIRFDIAATIGNKGLQPLVQIKIYDAIGREVKTLVNENLNPGKYEVSFNAYVLPSGIYFYRLNAGDYSDVKKMILLK